MSQFTSIALSLTNFGVELRKWLIRGESFTVLGVCGAHRAEHPLTILLNIIYIFNRYLVKIWSNFYSFFFGGYYMSVFWNSSFLRSNIMFICLSNKTIWQNLLKIITKKSGYIKRSLAIYWCNRLPPGIYDGWNYENSLFSCLCVKLTNDVLNNWWWRLWKVLNSPLHRRD